MGLSVYGSKDQTNNYKNKEPPDTRMHYSSPVWCHAQPLALSAADFYASTPGNYRKTSHAICPCPCLVGAAVQCIMPSKLIYPHLHLLLEPPFPESSRYVQG